MGTTADKLTYLNETKGKIKDSINLTGAGITNEDTFRSYAVKLRDSLLNVLNNGTIVLYNNFPKVSGTGSNISLSNTLEAPMFINKLNGDTKQSILPSEYTQVDYIESSGTQYIDTDYQITSTTNIEIKTRSGGSVTQVFGVEANNIGYILTAGYWRIFSTSGYINVNYLDIHEFKTDGSKVYLKNGTLVVDCEATPVNIPNYNLYLFARNVSGTPNYGSNAKIYYFKIYDNGILVRNFVPCYRNNDNEVGLYDLVNNVFYTNQGTGSFTYGSIAHTPDSPINIQCVEGIQTITIDDGNENSQTQEVNLGDIKLYKGDKIVGTPDNWSIVRNNGVIDSYNGETITTDYISTTGGLDTGATIVYELDTPTTTPITDTYLISQLNALYNVKSYNGQTNITVSGNLPMILEVSALKGE